MSESTVAIRAWSRPWRPVFWVALLGGLLAGRAAEAQPFPLSFTGSANATTFTVGQTLRLSVAIANPGIAEEVDIYLGILRPDGSVQFFTPGGFALGRVDNLASYVPIANTVPLLQPFSGAVPNFFSQTFTPTDQPGNYAFLFFAVNTGALAKVSQQDPSVRAETVEIRIIALLVLVYVLLGTS